jgi:hypothetical protein
MRSRKGDGPPEDFDTRRCVFAPEAISLSEGGTRRSSRGFATRFANVDAGRGTFS